jgi:hypothetical protein
MEKGKVLYLYQFRFGGTLLVLKCRGCRAPLLDVWFRELLRIIFNGF